MIPSINQPRTQRTEYKLRQKTDCGVKDCDVEYNKLFLYCSFPESRRCTRYLRYKNWALQEIGWMGIGQLNVRDYVTFFSELENRHSFGTDFAIHKPLEPHIREFNPVSERIAVLKVNTTPINIVLIWVHAPTEISTNNDKDAFYEDFDRIYDKILGNAIKIILGDLNVICGKENKF